MKYQTDMFLAVSLSAAALVFLACERPPASQPSEPPPKPASDPGKPVEPTAVTPKSPLLAEADKWTLAQALTKLHAPANAEASPDAPAAFDDPVRISAAVRIARLGKLKAACLPEPLTPSAAQRLRIARVGDSRWALGLADPADRVIAAPVFIDAEGVAEPAAVGSDESRARLFVSNDTDVVPNILVIPLRVMLINDETTIAIAAESLGGAAFELRFRNSYPYVAVVCADTIPLFEDPRDEDRGEAAIYRWDPDEPGFIGPAMDTLPEPCGPRFTILLRDSAALIPVGGEIAEPDDDQPAPPVEPEPETPPM